ncbi:MAG TPA: hypothetical protein VK922_10420, partial [Gemmatimonadaceae bacterium]|nr:hypothetical protein [Gemmatimonadaceae bacterium]
MIARRLSTLVAAGLVATSCARSPRAVELEPTTPAPAATQASVSETIDRSRPPELADPPALSLPPVVERTLPNGLRLLIVEHHELPILDAVLLVGTGGEADPADKP